MSTVIAETHTIRESILRVMKGLKAPKDSGDHKYAVYALTRVFGPSTVSMLACVTVLVALLTLVARKTVAPVREIEVTVVDPETIEIEELKDFIKEIELEPIEPPELSDVTTPVDLPDIAPAVDAPAIGQQSLDLSAPVPVLTKSPLIMRNLYGGRTAEGRGQARRAYGGTGKAEDAVLRALRWLKDHQDPNGSWAKADSTEPVAMTGLALLTFLAHGETPASEEFGKTVEAAMKFLIGVQKPNGSFSANAYSHAICTYAISEAYALTKIMPVKDSMERGLQIIIDGQQDCGGFNYGYAKGDRFDTSVAGWQFQAFKAAKMAGSTNPALEGAIEKGIQHLKSQAYAANGSGFVYSGTPGEQSASGGTWTMTGVGTLCLQLLGHANSPQVKTGLTVLEPLVCKWSPGGKNGIYGWYYVTQAKFQHGKSVWDAWNNQFADQFVKNQQSDGHWEDGDHGGPVYTTTLVALSLQVYYRYLPTYKQVDDAQPAQATSADDVVIGVL